MKKNIALFFILVATLIGCTSKKAVNNQVVILVDQTEKTGGNEAMVSTQELITLVNGEGTITWRQINAATLNPEEKVSLDVPSGATGLTLKRKTEAFQKKLTPIKKKFLGSVDNEAEGSSIYRPVCQAVAELKKSAGTKNLIIVSDMLENSEYGNFYRPGDYKQVRKLLVSSGDSLVTGSNVSVTILFDPQGNKKKQSQNDAAMRVWQQLFAEAGIPYVIKAKL